MLSIFIDLIVSPFFTSIAYILLCLMAVIIGTPLLFFRQTRGKSITVILTSLISFPILIVVYILFSVLLFPLIKAVVDLLFRWELDQAIW